VVQWNGAKWEVKSDWYQSDKSFVAPLVKEFAEKYAKDKNLKIRTCN
jgi:branched-chain amino acid transport system substrate-binding protein